MFLHSDLLMDITGTRIRVASNITRMTYYQAHLFNRMRADFTEFCTGSWRPILEAMCSLKQDVLVLRGTETQCQDAHAELVSAGYLSSNQTLVIRLVKDAITLNFGPRSGDNAWEEPLVVTIDRVMEDMDSELQIPDHDVVFGCFDLLGSLVASRMVEMRDGTHKTVVVEDYVNRPVATLFRELNIDGEAYLADPVKAKELAELSQRIAARYDVHGPMEYSKWPLTRSEHDMWKLDVSAEHAHVTEIWIDEMALLHTFHPNAYELRTETAIAQIKEAWQLANK